MLPTSKQASDITVKVPVDIARFRLAAYADPGEFPATGGLFESRIEDAIDVVESMTRLSLKRATYTCEWQQLPEAPRSERDNPLTFPGLYASVTSFERIDEDGQATAIPADQWRALPPSEIGSVRIVPASGRWQGHAGDCYSYGIGSGSVSDTVPAGYRVTGLAGCKPGQYDMPGPFFQGIALIFRYLWMTEPESMAAAETLMGRWLAAGSSV